MGTAWKFSWIYHIQGYKVQNLPMLKEERVRESNYSSSSRGLKQNIEFKYHFNIVLSGKCKSLTTLSLSFSNRTFILFVSQTSENFIVVRLELSSSISLHFKDTLRISQFTTGITLQELVATPFGFVSF